MNREHNQPWPGLWESPIQADDLGEERRFSDVQWDSDGQTLVWREERSKQGVLVCQSPEERSPRDLTGYLSVQARVGYGGGDFTVCRGHAYFVADGRLFGQALSGGPAESLTPAGGQCTAPSVSSDGRHILYVHSADEIDHLALVDTRGAHPPARLEQGHDFYMQPCWHPQGSRIAWVAWDHPNMPWDGTALYLGELPRGTGLALSSRRIVAGDPSGSTAIFQPCFSPDGRFLSYLSDEEGWFNLFLMDLNSGVSRVLISEESEQAVPAWVQGLRTHGWTADGQAIYLLKLKDGFSSLVRLDIGRQKTQTIGEQLGRYTDLKQIALSSAGERVALIASSPTLSPSIISFSSPNRIEVHQSSRSVAIDPAYLSQPRSLSWHSPTPASEAFCFGLYYPPQNPGFESSGAPPAILKIHGGPTSQYRAEYHAETQFLTSRGFAVLELNYRGSSGYGKAYAQALRGNWGILDVEDTHSAAQHLIGQGLADAKRLILMGGSAGGYTVLLCLIAYPGVFKAAICRYAVSNLLTLAADTHKFEQHYLDSLVGVLPRDRDRYEQRSPVFSADKIQNPVAIFQGEEDLVVPPSQTDQIVESLTRRGVPHVYRLYPGEGHGWRGSETIRDYYKTVEAFLTEQLGVP